jgi:hypothetical protein
MRCAGSATSRCWFCTIFDKSGLSILGTLRHDTRRLGGGISAASAGRTERADFRPARRLHRAGNFNGMVSRRSCQRIRMRPSACSCAINRSRGSSGAN